MKQKLLAILLVLGMVGALIPVFAVTSAAANGVALPDGATPYDGKPSTELSGTGTETDPYIIANTADFMYFYDKMEATATADKVFKMTGDVYWNAQNSTKYAVSSKAFAGILDGNGHTVYNAGYSGYSNMSVFGTVEGTIKNIMFDGMYINVNNGTTGGLCNALKGTKALIENCQFRNANVTGKNAAGVVNSIEGGATVRGCTFDGTISAKNTAGGIAISVGTNQSGAIEDCVNNAKISCAAANIGGIIGEAASDSGVTKLTITGCRNNGDLTSTKSAARVGGIIGRSYRLLELTITDCVNNGNIESTGATGGILGYLESSKVGKGVIVDGCRNTGAITSTGNNVGGLVGSMQKTYMDVIIKNSDVTGSVSGASCVGGFVGYHEPWTSTSSDIHVLNSRVDAVVKAAGDYAGLAFGKNVIHATAVNFQVSNCVLLGEVTAASGAGAVIGLLGAQKSISPKFEFASNYVNATVAAGAEGKAATLIGAADTNVSDVILTATNTKMLVAVKVGDASVSEPVTYYIGTGDGKTTEIAALNLEELTDGTALAALNAYATANAYGAWSQGKNAPELTAFFVAPEVTIDGASLTIGNSVTLNMFVYKKTLEAAGVSSLQSIHIRDSASENYQGKLVDDKYVFQIKGLTANDFGTTRSYTVQYVTDDNMVVVSKAVKEYSPLQYAINMYGKRADMEKLDSLLLAIVNYAEAAGATGAKEAFNAKHADADWTKLPTYEDVLAGDTNATQYTYKTLQTEKGLPALNTTYLDDRLILSVYLWDCDYTKVSVKIGNVDAGDITDFPSVEFYPTDLYNTIEFTFAKDAGEEVVATWSIMQYLDSYKNSSRKDFAKATAIYLYAVRTFCLVNQTTN